MARCPYCGYDKLKDHSELCPSCMLYVGYSNPVAPKWLDCDDPPKTKTEWIVTILNGYLIVIGLIVFFFAYLRSC